MSLLTVTFGSLTNTPLANCKTNASIRKGSDPLLSPSTRPSFLQPAGPINANRDANMEAK